MIPVILKSTVILAMTALTAALLRRRSAAVRHVVWAAGLVASLAVPTLSLLLPSWRIEGPVEFGVVDLGVVGAADVSSLSGLALSVWIFGASAGLGVMVFGAARLGWLAMHAEPFDEPRWNRAASRLAREMGIRQSVQLLVHPRARILGTWGVVRPRVLVPASATGWEDGRIRMVLAHEMAHIRRGDWPIQVLAQASRAIYWFNPLFWIAARNLCRQAEHASDDAVLRLGFSRPAYAEGLMETAGRLRQRPGPVLAVTPSFLEKRLRAVLDPRVRRVAATPWGVAVIIAGALAVTIPIAAVRVDGPPDPTLPGILAAAGSSDVCPATPAETATPPPGTIGAAFGEGPWHINEDRSIWLWDQVYVAGRPQSTAWIRPEGTRLAVTAVDLGGGGRPIETELACCYPLVFKTGALMFPSPGCWRVTATAGDRRLEFVTEVRAE